MVLQVTQSFLVQVQVEPVESQEPAHLLTVPVQLTVSLGALAKSVAVLRSVHVLSKRAAKSRQPALVAG
jgi:hypothetical protein